MTSLLFAIVFLTVYGFAIGKLFRKLNPFLMLIGMIFSLPIVTQAERTDEPLIYIPFIIGLLANFGNPFRKVIDFITDIKYNIQDSLNRNKQKRYAQSQAHRAYKENAENLNQQKEDLEAELKRNKQQSQDNINYQERKVREQLKKEAEELHRQREQFYKEKSNAKKKNNQSSTNNDDLNPKNFNDACEILGCKSTDDFATLKKAYRVLRAMYHPDKVEQFGGRRKKQAESEMKLINLAWVTIKKKIKK